MHVVRGFAGGGGVGGVGGFAGGREVGEAGGGGVVCRAAFRYETMQMNRRVSFCAAEWKCLRWSLREVGCECGARSGKGRIDIMHV